MEEASDIPCLCGMIITMPHAETPETSVTRTRVLCRSLQHTATCSPAPCVSLDFTRTLGFLSRVMSPTRPRRETDWSIEAQLGNHREGRAADCVGSRSVLFTKAIRLDVEIGWFSMYERCRSLLCLSHCCPSPNAIALSNCHIR